MSNDLISREAAAQYAVIASLGAAVIKLADIISSELEGDTK